MRKERGIGICMALAGIIMCILTSQIKLRGFSSGSDIGSKFFPYFASVGLILCGLGTFLTAKEPDRKESFLPKGGLKRVLILLAVLLVYVVMLNYLGFLISSPVLLYVVATLLAGEKKLKPIPKIIFSVVTTGVIYVVFVNVLSIMLPMGMLF